MTTDITTLDTLIEDVTPAALRYDAATEAVHTAWEAILSGHDGRFKGAVLRLRAAHADLIRAAQILDFHALGLVRHTSDDITRTVAAPECLDMTTVRQMLPAPSHGAWPLGYLSEYHPDDPDDRPAATWARRLITEHLGRLADLRAIVGPEETEETEEGTR